MKIFRHAKKMKEASNPRTLDYILNNLGLDKSAAVRAAVAMNPNIQHKFLQEQLAKDPSVEVRRAAAMNPRKMTPKTWEILSEDDDPSVVEALKSVWPEPPTEILHGNGVGVSSR